MTEIIKILLKLNGFQYATLIDLNIEYYNIQLSENTINLYTIFLPWGNYCYKRIPMEIVNYRDIFQKKMNYLFHGFELICDYIYELFILPKRDWTDHVHKLELNHYKRKEKGRKYNIEESSLDRLKRIV